MCACNKTEWYFTFENVEYAFGSHAEATRERRRLGAVGAPLKSRQKAKAKA